MSMITLVRRAALALALVMASCVASSKDAALASACGKNLGPLAGKGTDPLSKCQWGNTLVNAIPSQLAGATGRGVRVGIIDSGVDLTHPDVADRLDLKSSCSFIFSNNPTAYRPEEIGNGDCSNKAALQDFFGHGTHVASVVAGAVNGVGIQGIAPEATIVALKACTLTGMCFADSVAAALRYAGDIALDVVNLSLYADPYLYYCGNDAEQRAILADVQDAVRYAQQRGVLVVAAAGNSLEDLGHPAYDSTSPNWPLGTNTTRRVRNNCRIAPTELPGVLAVSAVGIRDLAVYSNVGNPIDVAAPGGDRTQTPGAPYGSILAAWTSTDAAGLYDFFSKLGLAHRDTAGRRYAWLDGTSMAAPFVTGVAALVKQRHPDWSPGAVSSAVCRTATPKACPTTWPLFPEDTRRCTGSASSTSFYGSGVVNALAAVAV